MCKLKTSEEMSLWIGRAMTEMALLNKHLKAEKAAHEVTKENLFRAKKYVRLLQEATGVIV